MAKYKLLRSGVFDTETGLTIPENDGNRHWQAYLSWLVAGNTPDPIDPDVIPTEDDRLDSAFTANDDFRSAMFEVIVELINRISALEGGPVLTPTQVRDWLKTKLP